MKANEANRNNPNLRAKAAQSLKDEHVFLLAAQAHIEAAHKAVLEAQLCSIDPRSYGHTALVQRLQDSISRVRSTTPHTLLHDEDMEPDSTYVGNLAVMLPKEK